MFIATEFCHLMIDYTALGKAFGCFAIFLVHSPCLDSIRDDMSNFFLKDREPIGRGADPNRSLAAGTARIAIA